MADERAEIPVRAKPKLFHSSDSLHFSKMPISLFPLCSIFFNMGIKELQDIVCVCVRERDRQGGREGQGEDGEKILRFTSSRR
jgi:hypothetical protein